MPYLVFCMSEVINMSNSMEEFKKKSQHFTKENTKTIEKLTIGRSVRE